MTRALLLSDVYGVPDAVTECLRAVGIHTTVELFDRAAAIATGTTRCAIRYAVADVVWESSGRQLRWLDCLRVYNQILVGRPRLKAKGGAA